MKKLCNSVKLGKYYICFSEKGLVSSFKEENEYPNKRDVNLLYYGTFYYLYESLNLILHTLNSVIQLFSQNWNIPSWREEIVKRENWWSPKGPGCSESQKTPKPLCVFVWVEPVSGRRKLISGWAVGGEFQGHISQEESPIPEWALSYVIQFPLSHLHFWKQCP